MKKTMRPISASLAVLCFAMALSSAQNGPQAKDAGTVTDIDGNVYKTVKIGAQIWMAENLKVTKFRDGTPIPEVKNGEAWAGLTTGACCVYDNDPKNAAVYGRMYNFFAVADRRNIGPAGWHVPSKAEMETLAAYLGGSSVNFGPSPANPKLKETGNAHWRRENQSLATNSSGFSALPGGVRWKSKTGEGETKPALGLFEYITMLSTWWTASEVAGDPSEAWSLHIDDSQVRHDPMPKEIGFYVRCIKDH
jgi:uncharacterized protein (TIGR02145 family)